MSTAKSRLSLPATVAAILFCVNPSLAASIRGAGNNTSTAWSDEGRDLKEKIKLHVPLNSTTKAQYGHLRASSTKAIETMPGPVKENEFYTLVDLNAVIVGELRSMSDEFVDILEEFDAIAYNSKKRERRRGVFKEYFTNIAHELNYEGEFLSSITIYTSYDYCQVLSVVFNDIAAFFKKQAKVLASARKKYRRLARYADGKADVFKILSADLGRLAEGTTPTAIAAVINGNMQELVNLVAKQHLYFETSTLPFEDNVLSGVIESVEDFIEILAD